MMITNIKWVKNWNSFKGFRAWLLLCISSN